MEVPSSAGSILEATALPCRSPPPTPPADPLRPHTTQTYITTKSQPNGQQQPNRLKIQLQLKELRVFTDSDLSDFVGIKGDPSLPPLLSTPISTARRRRRTGSYRRCPVVLGHRLSWRIAAPPAVPHCNRLRVGFAPKIRRLCPTQSSHRTLPLSPSVERAAACSSPAGRRKEEGEREMRG
ncbi:hypothetical protein Dimus_015997, partial [Dionaea muscipula]